MGYLMALEWKKFKLYKYVKSIMICIIVLTALNCLMMYTSKQEGEVMFESFSIASQFMQAQIRGVFIIFASVILSKVVLDEYKNNTIQVMFCYPISRKKIMSAKLAIVYLFTVTTILFAEILVIPLVGVFNTKMDTLPSRLTIGLFVSEIPNMLAGALLSGFVALIPFYFGMRKKSTSAAIVSACILSIFLASSAGANVASTYGIRMFIIGGVSMLIVAVTLNRKLDLLQENDV